MLTVYTFGDSILDCAVYNEHRVHPGQLIVRNDDTLFPEFQGNDLVTRGPAKLEHRAVDGATVRDLPGQTRLLSPVGDGVAVLTIGGNDLLTGLLIDQGKGITAFSAALEQFVRNLPIRPIYIGNVYDPTFGNDDDNAFGVEPDLARANHQRVNDVLGSVAAKHGTLVDLHQHFVKGDPTWLTRIIEPSLIGASEVRRCFLRAIVGGMS